MLCRDCRKQPTTATGWLRYGLNDIRNWSQCWTGGNYCFIKCQFDSKQFGPVSSTGSSRDNNLLELRINHNIPTDYQEAFPQRATHQNTLIADDHGSQSLSQCVFGVFPWSGYWSDPDPGRRHTRPQDQPSESITTNHHHHPNWDSLSRLKHREQSQTDIQTIIMEASQNVQSISALHNTQ